MLQPGENPGTFDTPARGSLLGAVSYMLFIVCKWVLIAAMCIRAGVGKAYLSSAKTNHCSATQPRVNPGLSPPSFCATWPFPLVRTRPTEYLEQELRRKTKI